jgi:diguanylate cyclase (GGDEF)-like protein
MDLDQTALIQVYAKQAERLHAQMPSEAAMGAVLAVTAAAGWGTAHVAGIAAWLLVAYLLYGVRYWISRKYSRSADAAEKAARWLKLFVVPAMITGAAWGVYGGAVSLNGSVLQAGIAVFCGAMMALAAVWFYAGSLLATIGFALLALAPPAAVLLTEGNAGAITIAAMLLALCAAIALIARGLRKLLWDGFVLQNETAQLTGHLDQRRNQIEKLNVALKTNMDKREQAELNLRRTAADLGLAQGKAKALADTLERVSPYCPVTGLLNRRSFLESVEVEWRRDQRERKVVTLLVAAMDHFEEYVETYGRQSADALLKRLGGVIKGFGKRASDVAGRYGDGQFALLLPGTDHRNAARMGEAIRTRIEGQKIAHAGAPNRDAVTVHVGVVTMIPARSMAGEELIKRLESSVYEARFQGGNKVVVYQPLDKIKIKRWNRTDDGPLNEQSLIQKLLLWGFDTEKSTLKPGTTMPDKCFKEEIVYAVLSGQLMFIIEGTQIVVKTGDCVFIPAGTTFYAEVEGDAPVVSFTATRSE